MRQAFLPWVASRTHLSGQGMGDRTLRQEIRAYLAMFDSPPLLEELLLGEGEAPRLLTTADVEDLLATLIFGAANPATGRRVQHPRRGNPALLRDLCGALFAPELRDHPEAMRAKYVELLRSGEVCPALDRAFRRWLNGVAATGNPGPSCTARLLVLITRRRQPRKVRTRDLHPGFQP